MVNDKRTRRKKAALDDATRGSIHCTVTTWYASSRCSSQKVGGIGRGAGHQGEKNHRADGIAVPLHRLSALQRHAGEKKQPAAAPSTNAVTTAGSRR